MYDYDENILIHYGTKRHSGRYPWGSGENPFQHSGDFLSRIEELKSNGLSETEIAKSLNLSTTEYRAFKAIAKNERRAEDVSTAKKLREKGLSLDKIAKQMGYKNDSSIRSLLDEDAAARMKQAVNVANFLKDQIDKKGIIDVGTGVEKQLGNISREKFNQALTILEAEGYPIIGRGIPQVTNPGKQTNLKLACPPGTDWKDIYSDDIYNKIHTIKDYVSHDGGDTFDPKWVYPKSMDSKRLKIRYAEDGGTEKDGVIELRRGVDDLSLGDSVYAQVRILVDDTHYLKGMAVYSDDLPDGIDVLFNTNKSKDVPMEKVLKPIDKKDPKNPFGSLIKEGINDPDKITDERGGQSYYYDKDGKKQLSLINKRAEEGDWDEWANKLSAQFLSKQSKSLVNRQLKLALDEKKAEYDEISNLNNPVLKKNMLQTFADDCDSAAVHLYAASLPRQRYQVILPIPSMKENEVYAPNYSNGETVALVRYPHGGTFEIPILTVNNKQPEAKKILGTNPKDVVGINKKVADRLSGADFDGDTVMVIPCNSSNSKVKIISTKPLEGLKDFDPKMSYPEIEGMHYMKDTQKQMGTISNLITDMTIKGASPEKLARAVRHSMVVIDAEKHKLNYKQSEIDNGIAALKKEYQGKIDENGKIHYGASTLISRAKSQVSVPKRQGSPRINPETGEYVWKLADDLTYVNKKTGKTEIRKQKSTAMSETKDARTLSTGHPIEEAYAEYANSLKDLANKARKESLSTGKIAYSASAKRAYQKEVESLNAKLEIAEANAPKERRAQVLANGKVEVIKKSNPDIKKKELKKISQRALVDARLAVGARSEPINFTDKEWEAVQAGAISSSKLEKIIKKADLDDLRKRATPKTSTQLSDFKISKINTMKNLGYTNDEIAKAVGVSASTVVKYLKQ